MVERWLCEASSGTGEVGSGCYLTMIARAMNPRLRVIQKFMSREEILGLIIWGKAIISEGMKRRDLLFLRWIFPSSIKGWNYLQEGGPIGELKILGKKGEEIKKSKVNWRDIGIGTTRRLRSKPSTAKFRLLEEWISRCIKWTGIPARMDESMGRKPRTSMGARCGGTPTI